MSRRKYFLTQKQIQKIVRSYGGFRKYEYLERNEYGRIYLREKSNKYLWMGIKSTYDKNIFEVTFTDETGLIIKRDYWNIVANDITINSPNR